MYMPNLAIIAWYVGRFEHVTAERPVGVLDPNFNVAGKSLGGA